MERAGASITFFLVLIIGLATAVICLGLSRRRPEEETVVRPIHREDSREQDSREPRIDPPVCAVVHVIPAETVADGSASPIAAAAAVPDAVPTHAARP